MRILEPEIGCWYKDGMTDAGFEVVAIDDIEHTIAIQHISGELEELDSDDWYRLELYTISPPGEWTQAYTQDLDLCDYGGDVVSPARRCMLEEFERDLEDERYHR